MKAYIVDIDGTLADLKHRLHFIKGEGKQDWKSFEANISGDEPIQPVIDMVNDLSRSEGAHIVLCTGRKEQSRAATIQWLNKYNISFYGLYMRGNDDHRKDCEVKDEMHFQLKMDGFKPVLYIDDRNQVVNMIRNRGDICLQVQDGNF